MADSNPADRTRTQSDTDSSLTADTELLFGAECYCDDVINRLPDEILELILGHLSPYRDYKNAMLVCKRWRRIMQGVKVQELESFHHGVQNGKLKWCSLEAKSAPTVSERYSHCACYHNKSMYIFGGCTHTCTTFNDLWRLDLTTGEWVRPLATGVYPSPTACATLVPYEDQLILFGGWCHPTPYTFHQASKLFNQLHSYNTVTNKWSQILCPVTPPGTAGHGSTIVKDKMIVIGGYHGQTSSSNDVWVYDLKEVNWIQKKIVGPKPLPRYGHTQVMLDDQHILIVGGCGGPNKQLGDMWMLNMESDAWFWQKIDVINLQNSAPQLWCHPGCLVNDKIIVLSKNSRVSRAITKSTIEKLFKADARRGVWIPPKEEAGAAACRAPKSAQDHRLCSMANRTHFKRSHPETSESSSQESSSDTDEGSSVMGPPRSPRLVALQKSVSRSVAQNKYSPSTSDRAPADEGGTSSSLGQSAPRPGMPSVRPNAMRNRQKQLETLKYYESKIRQMNKPVKEVAEEENLYDFGPLHSKPPQNPMYVHALDVSKVLTEAKATWLEPHDCIDANTPDATIFHSTVKGRGELIMFGGVQMDLSTMQRGLQYSSQHVSNSVHFVRPVKTLR